MGLLVARVFGKTGCRRYLANGYLSGELFIRGIEFLEDHLIPRRACRRCRTESPLLHASQKSCAGDPKRLGRRSVVARMARQGLFDEHSLDSLKDFIQDDRLVGFNTFDMRWIGSQ